MENNKNKWGWRLSSHASILVYNILTMVTVPRIPSNMKFIQLIFPMKIHLVATKVVSLSTHK